MRHKTRRLVHNERAWDEPVYFYMYTGKKKKKKKKKKTGKLKKILRTYLRINLYFLLFDDYYFIMDCSYSLPVARVIKINAGHTWELARAVKKM